MKYQRRPPERREVGLKGPSIDSVKFWRERFFGWSMGLVFSWDLG